VSRSQHVVVPVLAGMGNALMAQPMIRRLAEVGRVTVLARNRSIAGVFLRLPEVAAVEIFGNEPRQFGRLLRRLRRLRADLLVVPYPSNRWQYSLLAAASGVRRIVMHRYAVGRWRALHPLVRHRVPTYAGRHDVLANWDLLAEVLPEVGVSPPPTFPVRADELAKAREVLGVEGRFCALHAGSGRTVFAASKRWPPAKFAELVPRLRTLGLMPVFLVGPEDEGVAGTLRDTGIDAPIYELLGGLEDVAAVLAASELYVGSDSGLAHLAAAVGTPPVTLFGPARPDEVSPWQYRHLVVQTPATCSPCFRYPQDATSPQVACRPPYCIDRIEIEAVVATVEAALAQLSNRLTNAASSGTSVAPGLA
jgi:ADP-heptose:LPS heptosyltransferase